VPTLYAVFPKILTVTPYGDWRSTLCNRHVCQLQSHVTQKVGRITKIRPNQIQILCPSLRIRDQFPAPIVSGRGDSFWKRPDFQLWRARDLDLESGHTSYSSASLIDLYLHANFIQIEETFCWWTFQTGLLGRLCQRVNLTIWHIVQAVSLFIEVNVLF